MSVAANPLEEIKLAIRQVSSKYTDRLDRARRIYVEERAGALKEKREIEYKIKLQVSKYFSIDYTDVCFCGSAQLGFSVHKDRLFILAESDLDIGCISVSLFQKAWMDVIDASHAFTDSTAFLTPKVEDIDTFKDQILRRGMIRVRMMPKSPLSTLWRQFEDRMTRSYVDTFSSVSIAIYMNEYAFCWKQDSALTQLLGR